MPAATNIPTHDMIGVPVISLDSLSSTNGDHPTMSFVQMPYAMPTSEELPLSSMTSLSSPVSSTSPSCWWDDIGSVASVHKLDRREEIDLTPRSLKRLFLSALPRRHPEGKREELIIHDQNDPEVVLFQKSCLLPVHADIDREQAALPLRSSISESAKRRAHVAIDASDIPPKKEPQRLLLHGSAGSIETLDDSSTLKSSTCTFHRVSERQRMSRDKSFLSRHLQGEVFPNRELYRTEREDSLHF